MKASRERTQEVGRRWLLVALALTLVLPSVPPGHPAEGTASTAVPPPPPERVSSAVREGISPAVSASLFSGYFTENVGQVANEQVRYYGSVGGMQIGFAESAILFVLKEAPSMREARPDPLGAAGPGHTTPEPLRGVLVRATFEGANPVLPVARGELPHRNNYFIGNEEDWRTNVRNYREVVYENLYDGIDLIYRHGPTGAKYEFLVHPSADPGQIAVAYEGIQGMRVEPNGVFLDTAVGELRDTTLYAYEEGGDPVPCAFVPAAENAWGIACEDWLRSRPLVIDPLVYATFLGGSDYDYGEGIAVDTAGAAYVAGETKSTEATFPVTPGAFDTVANGDHDAFVAKLDADGATLLYATYVGGAGIDYARAIAIDTDGNAYITGYTTSDQTTFPETVGANDTTANGGFDAFVAKLDANGSALIYATFFGGANSEIAWGIAVDSLGRACITGETASTAATFPETLGAFDEFYNGGNYDAFVARMSADGSTIEFATYLGGGSDDKGFAIALDAAGAAYVTGSTSSDESTFPVTPGAFDTVYNGGGDAFVAKVFENGTALNYATYLGGDQNDIGNAIAVDTSGAAYVTGHTTSNETTFPDTPGAFDTGHGGSDDAFVVKLDVNGIGLHYATFLGGDSEDKAYAIAVDTAGAAYITGYTYSNETSFPVTPGAYDTDYDWFDGYVAKLDANGSALLYATYLGGASAERPYGIAVDTGGAVYVTGETWSTETTFPVTPGAFDTTFGGGFTDVFVAKLDPLSYLVTIATDPTGFDFRLNGTNPAAPYTFYCGADSPVQLEALSPQATGNVTWYFAYWSDGGNQTHDITCSGPSTYTAYFYETEGPYVFNLDATPDSVTVGDTVTVNATIEDTATGNSLVNATELFVDVIGQNGTGTPMVAVDGTFDTPVEAVTLSLDTTGWSAGLYALYVHGMDFYGNWGPFTVDGVTVNAVPNQDPVADAGPDQSAYRNEIVYLNGTASYDPDGSLANVSWTQIGGISVTINDPYSLLAWFVPTQLGIYGFNLTVRDDAGNASTDWVTVDVQNRLPDADAGPDQTSYRGTVVYLNATNSSDPDGDSLTFYEWTQASGPVGVTLNDPWSVVAWFNPTEVGVYSFDLTVGDVYGANGTDSVTVTVDLVAPVADLTVSPNPAGINQTVTFNASGSYDLDGGIVNYTWDFGDGDQAVNASAVETHAYAGAGVFNAKLTVWDADGLNDTVTVPVSILVDSPPVAIGLIWPTNVTDRLTPLLLDALNSTDDNGITNYTWDFGDGDVGYGGTVIHAFTAVGTLWVTLTVSDALTQSDAALIEVTVVNLAPTASVSFGPATVYRGTEVTLNGTGSSDPEGDPLTYTWNQTGGPEAVALTALDVNWTRATFLPMALGQYSFNLTVDDGFGGNDTIPVTVEVINQAPVADAGADQTVVHGTNVTLNASASSDADGDMLTYDWEQDLSAAAPAAFLSNASSPVPWFVPVAPGVYAFNLTVSDGVDNATDRVAVNVTNIRPVANAGPDQDLQKATNLLVVLNGSASSDPDGDPLTYAWSCDPAVALDNASAAATSFTTSSVGTWTCTLTVDDGFDTDADDVVINVTGQPPIAGLNASALTATIGEPILFNGSASTDPDGVIVNYTWDFGDGEMAYGMEASHAWSLAAAYTVTLTVQDDDGYADDATVNVTLTGPPPGLPAVDITLPANGTTVTEYSLGVGGVAANASLVQVRVADSPMAGDWVNAAGTSAWTATLDLAGLANGVHTIEARAFDLNGTVESPHDSILFLFAIPPSLTVWTPAQDAVLTGAVMLNGTATPGATVQIAVDGGNWQNVSAANGTWSYDLDTALLADGAHAVEFRSVLGTAVSPTVTRDVTTLNQPDFQLQLSAPSIQVEAGDREGGILTLTVLSVRGFSGTVTLQSEPYFDHLEINLLPYEVGPGGSAQVRVLPALLQAPGTYQVTLNGTSGGIWHTVTFDVIVVEPATGGGGLAPLAAMTWLLALAVAAVLAALSIVLRRKPKREPSERPEGAGAATLAELPGTSGGEPAAAEASPAEELTCAACGNAVALSQAVGCEHCDAPMHGKCADGATACPKCGQPMGERPEEEAEVPAKAPVPVAAPAAAAPAATAPPVERGVSLLILQETPKTAFARAAESLRQGTPVLVLTSTFPEKLQKANALEGARVLWFTDTGKGKEVLDPKRLDFEAMRTVGNFVKEHRGGVLLLHGLEYLHIQNGFDRLYKFLRKVLDVCAPAEVAVLAYLPPDGLPKEDLSVLEKAFDRVERPGAAAPAAAVAPAPVILPAKAEAVEVAKPAVAEPAGADYQVAVLGTSGSGKTVYVAVMDWLVGRGRSPKGWKRMHGDVDTNLFLEDLVDGLTGGVWPAATPKGTRQRLHIRLYMPGVLGTKLAHLQMLDLSGETVAEITKLDPRKPGWDKDPEVRELVDWMKRSSGLLILIDKERARREERVYQRLLLMLEKVFAVGDRDRLEVPVAFVFTKDDVYGVGDPDAAFHELLPELAQAASIRVRRWKVFSCTAVGHTVEGKPPKDLEPRGLLEPLEFLLE